MHVTCIKLKGQILQMLLTITLSVCIIGQFSVIYIFNFYSDDALFLNLKKVINFKDKW